MAAKFKMATKTKFAGKNYESSFIKEMQKLYHFKISEKYESSYAKMPKIFFYFGCR
jgi:hypothetical protein